MISQAGVYLPFKQLLQGSGMNIVETATSITIGTTGAGPGGGDMLQSVYATNGVHGIVDQAVLAQGLTSGANVPYAQAAGSVPWGGVTGAPATFPTSWAQITGIPATFPSTWASVSGKPSTFTPSPHKATHLPGGSDFLGLANNTAAGLLAQLSGNTTDYVGGDNACHALPSYANPDGDVTPPASPTAFDDEFTNTGGGTPASKWTLSGTKALVTANLVAPTYLQLAFAYSASGTVQVRATESLSGIGAGFGFQVKVRCVLAPYGAGATGSSYMANVGFGLLSGSHSIGVMISTQAATDNAGNQYYYPMFQIYKGSGMANDFVSMPAVFAGTDLRFLIWNDISGGTPGQLSVAVSTDAINWVTIYTEPFATGGSLNGNFPTSLALNVDSGGSSTGAAGSAMGAFDYVRKVS